MMAQVFIILQEVICMRLLRFFLYIRRWTKNKSGNFPGTMGYYLVGFSYILC
jgi:hypothetical protein